MTCLVPKMSRIDNPVIEFLEEDVRRFHHPHNDALVVNIQVRDYALGSSWQWQLSWHPLLSNIPTDDREQLVPKNAPPIGFEGTRVLPLSVVTLSVTVGDYPQQITKDVAFLVVDYSSAYNAILGRPSLNSWKAVTLTYHLMIKFPIDYGVG